MHSIISRRQALKWLGMGSLATVAAACGGPTPTPVVQIVEKTKVVEKKETVQVEKVVEKPVVVTATPAPTVAGSDMAADQTVKYVTRGFGRLDPASEGGFGRPFISHMWMPFFLRDVKHNISPWLGTKYEMSADLKTCTVSIDPRAVWSDGSPLKAQEAIDYWIYGMHPDSCKGCYLALFAGFDIIKGGKDLAAGKTNTLPGAVAKDDKTIVFTLENPDPIFANRLAMFDCGFIKMEDIKAQIGDPWAKDHKTFMADAKTRVYGPYMIKTWDIDKKQYEIVQNPKWWGDKKPKITRIVCSESADENISYVMWQNNEVDVAQYLTNIREQIRKTDPKAFYMMPYPTNFFWYMMANREPMDDINVRKALMHSVDFTKAITAAWEGARDGRAMTSILTPEMQCYKKDIWPEWGYNPTKAKEELAKSKYGSADKLPKLRISPGGSSPNYIRTAEVMLESWKTNLGITNAEVKPGGVDAFGQDQKLVQFLRSSQGAILPDALSMLGSHWNYYKAETMMNMKDAELDKLFDEATPLKRDDPKFCTLCNQIEAKILGQYVIAPMIWDLYEYEVKSWVKNFSTNVDNNWASLLDMYIAKH